MITRHQCPGRYHSQTSSGAWLPLITDDLDRIDVSRDGARSQRNTNSRRLSLGDTARNIVRSDVHKREAVSSHTQTYEEVAK